MYPSLSVIALASALSVTAPLPATANTPPIVSEIHKLEDNVTVIGENFDNVVVLPPDNDASAPATHPLGQSYSTAADDSSTFARRGGGTCVAPVGVAMTCQDGTGYVVRKASVSKMNLGYAWGVAWYSGSNANVKGRGYAYGREVWRGGGNATSGSFSVPWYAARGGELMSVKKVQVRSMSAPAGVAVNWQ